MTFTSPSLELPPLSLESSINVDPLPPLRVPPISFSPTSCLLSFIKIATQLLSNTWPLWPLQTRAKLNYFMTGTAMPDIATSAGPLFMPRLPRQAAKGAHQTTKKESAESSFFVVCFGFVVVLNVDADVTPPNRVKEGAV